MSNSLTLFYFAGNPMFFKTGDECVFLLRRISRKTTAFKPLSASFSYALFLLTWGMLFVQSVPCQGIFGSRSTDTLAVSSSRCFHNRPRRALCANLTSLACAGSYFFFATRSHDDVWVASSSLALPVAFLSLAGIVRESHRIWREFGNNISPLQLPPPMAVPAATVYQAHMTQNSTVELPSQTRLVVSESEDH